MLEQLRARLAELHESRATAITAMEAATAPAETESRSLTADEDTAFTEARSQVLAIDADIESVSAQVDELEQIEARSAALAERAPFNVNAGRTKEDPYGEVRYDTGTAELRGRVGRALETERGLSDEERSTVEALVARVDQGEDHGDRLARHIIATGRPEYRTGFSKVMSGHPEMVLPEEARALQEARAASLTGNAGGFAVPYTIDTTIIDTGAGSVNPMRQIATVKSITTNKWTGVSSAGVTASYKAEAAQVGDNAPTLAAPTIDAERADAFVPFSIEVGQDWVGMESDIRAMFQVAKDDLEAVKFFTGAGSGSEEPTGIVTALDGTASEVAPGTAETFASGDVYALETALPAKHRTRASWTANKAIYNSIRQFDTNGGSAMWERIGAGQPSQLLGYSAYEASAMDGAFDAAADADNFLLILGDFSKYYIVDRIGMSVELVPHLFATANNRPSGQRGLLAMWRNGGGCVDINAFRMLNVATAA